MTHTEDGLPVPQRYWAVVAIWLALAMAVLDSAIANVSLPTIADELGASPAASIWVINAYQIAIVMLLLPLASLGEIMGYKRVYSVGLAVFVLASVGCTLANGLVSLALWRFLQGFGAAAVMAVNGALVRFTYSRNQLGRGVGYNALVVAVSSAAGPTIAASILAVGSWRWLFAVNVPIGVASLVIGLKALPEVGRSRRPFDWLSAILNALAFSALFIAASDFAQDEVSRRSVAALLIGAAAGVLLIVIARRERDPLIPIDLLRVPILRLSYAASVLAFGAQMIGLVALPFYLQTALAYDRVQVGLHITALPLGVAVAAPIAGRLADRFPAGLLGGIGLVILTVGFGLLSLQPSSEPTLVVALVLCGFGFGLFQAPNNRTMLGAAPPQRSGAAAGMLATARLVGQTCGAVIVAFLFRLGETKSVVPFLVASVLGGVAAGFSFGRLKPSPGGNGP